MSVKQLREDFVQPAHATGAQRVADYHAATMNGSIDAIMRQYHARCIKKGKIVSMYPIFDFRFIPKKAQKRAKRKLFIILNKTIEASIDAAKHATIKEPLDYTFFLVRKNGALREYQCTLSKKGNLKITK